MFCKLLNGADEWSNMKSLPPLMSSEPTLHVARTNDGDDLVAPGLASADFPRKGK